MQAGGQKEFNFDELLKTAGYSAAAGGALGGIIPIAGAVGKEAVDLAKRVEIDDSATLSANPIPFRLKPKKTEITREVAVKRFQQNKDKTKDYDEFVETEGDYIQSEMQKTLNFANNIPDEKNKRKYFEKSIREIENTLTKRFSDKLEKKKDIEQRRKEANIDRFGYDPNDPTQNKKAEARPRDESSGHAADIVPANFGPPAHDMNMMIEEEFTPEGYSTMSADIGENYENLKSFITSRRGTKEYDQEVAFFRKLFDIKGNPEAEVTIYRASPTDDLRPGDLVTPIKADAESYVEQSKVTRQDIRDAEKKRRLEGDEPVDLAKEKTIKKMDAIMDIFPENKVTPSKVFTYKVKAKDLRWDGNNGLVRWGYFPQDNVTQIKKQ